MLVEVEYWGSEMTNSLSMAQEGKHNREGKALALTRQQVFAVANAMPSPKLRMVVLTLYAVAGRVSEVCQLKTEFVDLANRSIKIPAELTKTDQYRTAALPDWFIEEVTKYLEGHESEWLFPGRWASSGHLNSQAFSQDLKQVLRELNLGGASTHSFRRSALTRLAEKGYPLHVIAEVSGHKSLSELQKYLSVLPAQYQAAVADL